MKYYSFLLLFFTSFFYGQKQVEPIRINQLGYLEKGEKVFVVADLEDQSYELLDERGIVVFNGKLKERGIWDKSGEKIALGDFTAFTKSGKYTLKVGDRLSYPFLIDNEVYKEVKNAALKSYYLQRVSMPIEEEFAGIYKRERTKNFSFHYNRCARTRI